MDTEEESDAARPQRMPKPHSGGCTCRERPGRVPWDSAGINKYVSRSWADGGYRHRRLGHGADGDRDHPLGGRLLDRSHIRR